MKNTTPERRNNLLGSSGFLWNGNTQLFGTPHSVSSCVRPLSPGRNLSRPVRNGFLVVSDGWVMLANKTGATLHTCVRSVRMLRTGDEVTHRPSGKLVENPAREARASGGPGSGSRGQDLRWVSRTSLNKIRAGTHKGPMLTIILTRIVFWE